MNDWLAGMSCRPFLSGRVCGTPRRLFRNWLTLLAKSAHAADCVRQRVVQGKSSAWTSTTHAPNGELTGIVPDQDHVAQKAVSANAA
jgi:hypothetical protein